MPIPVNSPQLNVLSNTVLPGHYPILPGKPVMIRNAKDCRRLFGKMILGFQRGQIDSGNAKTLSYLLIGFLQSCTQADIEERLKNLEQKTGVNP